VAQPENRCLIACSSARYFVLAPFFDLADSDADLSALSLVGHELVCVSSRRRDPMNPSEDAMPVIQLTSKALRGLSFSVPELTLIRSWSEANGLRMAVRLDHGSDTEDFEEVLAFHCGDSNLCRWMMWRDARTVFVQPLIGRARRYGTVAEAFEASAAKQRVVLTDIKPTRWPA
jgi:hypothetical protein